jgi:DNA-binding NarL/FixJ family response regulator
MVAIDLDPTSVRKTLERLRADVTLASPREFVRATTCVLSLGARSGITDPSQGELAWELIREIADPLVVTSFESIYSTSLALAARYDRALEVASALLRTAEHYRLDFARPYGLFPAALAHAGKRQWHAAECCLDEASQLGSDAVDAFVEQLAYATRVRVLVQQGRYAAALAISVPDATTAIPALRAEVVTSRALALAVGDRLDEALHVVSEVERVEEGVEAVVLRDAVAAIISLKRNQPDALERVHLVADAAFRTGGLDLLVTSYRGVPEILEILLRDPRDADRVRGVVGQANDDDLLDPLGQASVDGDRRTLLTPREREVYNLVAQGLTNRQIASVLVISESTAKLHVQHVYNKLGVHSRKALAIQAALERSRSGDVRDARE